VDGLLTYVVALGVEFDELCHRMRMSACGRTVRRRIDRGALMGGQVWETSRPLGDVVSSNETSNILDVRMRLASGRPCLLRLLHMRARAALCPEAHTVAHATSCPAPAPWPAHASGQFGSLVEAARLAWLSKKMEMSLSLVP
jgi:hypothetical protein